MPLISPAGFPIAYRLGYRGGKVEARVKLNDDIRAIAIALNSQPNTWLTRAYRGHWVGPPMVRVSAHNFSQWFQHCDIRMHKDCPNLTTQSLGLRPTSLKTIPAFVSFCWQGSNSQRHLDAECHASLHHHRRCLQLAAPWSEDLGRQPKQKRHQTRFSSPIVPIAGPSSAPAMVRDPATPNFEPVPFPTLPAPHGVSVSPTLSHYSADGHIITTSSTLVADPASDIFGSSAQLPSPVVENIPREASSVILVSSASSDTDENLELLYPPQEAITFDLVRAVRLIVWTHDAIPTCMTVYPREVGQAYSELLLRDYQQTLLAIGFNVNIPGEMLVEIQQHQMWTPWGSDLPLPITRNNQLVFIRSRGALADPDVVLDDLFPPN
ncbi:hypothetical protein B0H10DRAFT_2220773 [Mycena sp. CBHHK59/15]|nr:hypothetical protein B0H10DRAFT_2220773 [Mycena sp. CBHHK59/15]